MLSQIVTLGLIASLALAQNDVGTYLTVCDEYEGAQMYAEVNRTKGYDGLNTAGYCSSTNTPMAGDKVSRCMCKKRLTRQECRSPFLISYFDSSSTSYFQCAQSRPYNCGFFCPLGTSCIATNDYLHEQTFYTCGVTVSLRSIRTGLTAVRRVDLHLRRPGCQVAQPQLCRLLRRDQRPVRDMLERVVPHRHERGQRRMHSACHLAAAVPDRHLPWRPLGQVRAVRRLRKPSRRIGELIAFLMKKRS